MRPRHCSAFLGLLVLCPLATAPPAAAGETARCGGGGGNKTLTLDCGPDAFVVGLETAGSTSNFPLDPINSVRQFRLLCRKIPASGAPGLVTQTEMAKVDGLFGGYTYGREQCSAAGAAVTALRVRCGLLVDRIDRGFCSTRAVEVDGFTLNVGGPGGSEETLKCPSGEALYKFVVKTGDRIDSIKGTCRAFREAAAPAPTPTRTPTPHPQHHHK